MTEPPPPSFSVPRPPLAPASSSVDDDVALHHRSISDDAPSPSAAGAPPLVFTSAKASASSFASKLAFGGRKLLSPLAGVAAGVTSSSSGSSTTNTGSIHSASGETKSSRASVSLPNVASSLAGANAAVSDAASAVTSSISSFLSSGLSGSSAYPLTMTMPSNTAPLSSSSASGVSQLDAAELEQLEAEYRQVTAQQRMQILEDLVQHRRADWSYLKAMHAGTSYWLNVALLKETHVLAHVGERAAIRRSVQFFYLGLGLGKLMSEVRHAQLLAMEGCQLLDELEFYFASAPVQSMKLMVATSTPSLHEPLHKMDDEELLATALHEPFRPTIYKWNQRAVFRRLVTPSIPFPLDYREVMLSLCDMLALVYSKLVEDNTCSENVFLFQAIVRFDEKIKKLVIDPVKKEFSAVAATVVADELVSVRKVFSSDSNSNANGSSSRHASHTNAAPPIPAAHTTDTS